MRSLHKPAKLRNSIMVLDEDHWNEMVAAVMKRYATLNDDWKRRRAHQYRACKKPGAVKHPQITNLTNSHGDIL